MARTKIEWANESWNPVTGCSAVSSGCKNCYARKMANRLRGRCGYDANDPFKITLHEDKLVGLWDLQGKESVRIFVESMGDLFHDDVPDEWIDRVVSAAELVYGRGGKLHDYLFLTKRPDRMYRWAERNTLRGFVDHPNFWIGVTAENQEMADKRLPVLKMLPAAIRWVSIEPMLTAVNIEPWLKNGTLKFVVAGPETGAGARKAESGWFMSLYRQCRKYDVPFFDKRKVGGLSKQFPKGGEDVERIDK